MSIAAHKTYAGDQITVALQGAQAYTLSQDEVEVVTATIVNGTSPGDGLPVRMPVKKYIHSPRLAEGLRASAFESRSTKRFTTALAFALIDSEWQAASMVVVMEGRARWLETEWESLRVMRGVGFAITSHIEGGW